MCGIFGILQSKPGIDFSLVRELIEMNLSRGDRSWGLFCWSPQRSQVLRCTEKFNPYKHSISTSWAQMVLGHVRAPTSGESRLLDTHPFETERFLLAMNGIFTKYPEGASRESRVDSAQFVNFLESDRYTIQEWLGRGVSISTRIKESMEKSFEGQAACWMWDKREEQLYLWRATNPISYRRDFLENDQERFLFSSSMLSGGLDLLEGKVCRLSGGETIWTIVEDFKTDSIYSFIE